MKNFHNLVLTGLLALGVQLVSAQNVGIGTTQPDQSAILDLSSSSKGLLMPRMTLKEKDQIPNPAQGLIVYQTDEKSGFYYFTGENWKPLGIGQEAYTVTLDPDNWALAGNSAPAGSFLGTTNARPLLFKAENKRIGELHHINRNVFFGLNSGNNSTGTDNIGIGSNTLLNNSKGFNNISLGTDALKENTTGTNNTAIGISALLYNKTSAGNVAIGGEALMNTDGPASSGFNVAIGRRALKENTSGVDNVAIGFWALLNNTTGSSNFGVGKEALRKMTTGSNNLGIGNYTGWNNQTGSNNLFIGFEAGYNEMGSNKLYIANTRTTTPLIYGDFSAKFISIGDVSVAKRNAAAANGYGLLVKGGIITEKVKVALVNTADWADYVFEEEYDPMSLEEVEKFVKIHKHLPKVPSAEQIVKNGLDVHEISKMFMEKIEELTLYMIQLNKEVKALREENKDLRKQVDK